MPFDLNDAGKTAKDEVKDNEPTLMDLINKNLTLSDSLEALKVVNELKESGRISKKEAKILKNGIL